MDTRLPTAGLDLQSELSSTQFTIPAGAGATYAAANNIATVTFNAAHGLTLSPAAGTMPNYFIGFGGATSAPTGTGVLVGNIFRILTIPSATAITIYCTLTALTVTALTGIPIFFPPFTAGLGSSFVGGPSQVIATAGSYPLPNLTGAYAYYTLGANIAARYNPDQTAVILDGYTTPGLPGGTTPAVAPTWRDIIPVSNSDAIWGAPPWMALWANGAAGTSRANVVS